MCEIITEKSTEETIMADSELLTQLRQLLVKRFSDSELHTLCFDLGVEYDDLPGSGRADKARELVTYMDQHDRLADLMRVGRRSRPDVPWPELNDVPVAKPSPPASSPADSPALRAIKRKTLEQRLADLSAEYEAANDQLGSTLAAVDRLRIQRQIEALEAEIGQIDAELKALG